MPHRTTIRFACAAAITLLQVIGCVSHQPATSRLHSTDIAPHERSDPTTTISLETSQLRLIQIELLPVDLLTVIRVALARNLDIQQVREMVESSRGRYESAVGSAFPVIAPTALFEHVEGSVRATEGNLVGVGFNSFQASAVLQWVINPGKVVYEIVAAKKRLSASENVQEAVTEDTIRRAAIQFYDLVLAQIQVSTAHQGVSEAEEFLRISRLKIQSGTGVPVDERRAEARLAERQQDLVSALKGFYDNSVSLAVTLHLDSRVTLVPSVPDISPCQLVRDEIEMDELVAIAIAFRPDFASVRKVVEAVEADGKQTWWGNWGPTLAASYQYGGIGSHANNIVGGEGIPGNLIVNPASSNGSFSSSPVLNGLVKESIARSSRRIDGRADQTYGFSEQQRASAGVGWRLSLSAFGDQRTAKANVRRAMLELDHALDQITAQVVRAVQASKTHRQLIEFAKQHVDAAEESLRLVQANFAVGTMTPLDVLQAEDTAAKARLRLAKAVVDYNQSQIELVNALGILSKTGLDGINDSEPVKAASGN